MRKLLERFIKTNGEKVDTPPTPLVVSFPERYRVKLISLLGFYAEEAGKICEKAYPFMSSFPASMKHHDLERDGLWHHSWDVATNMALRLTAKSKPKKEIYIGFLVGLFHDVGKTCLYDIEHNYNYNAFSLNPLPKEAKITGTRNNQRNHAMLSCIFISPLMGDLLENLSGEEIYLMCEAIVNHHDKTTIDNVYLNLLKEVDIDAVKTFEKKVTEKTEEDQVEKTQPVIKQEERIEKIDLNTWFDCLREKIYTVYNTGYHYYILNHENRNILLLTYPKIINEINEIYRNKTGQQYHNDLIIDALLKQKYIIALSKDDTVNIAIRMAIKSSGLERNLKFIILDADKILSEEDMKKYFSNDIIIKKINGNFIGG